MKNNFWSYLLLIALLLFYGTETVFALPDAEVIKILNIKYANNGYNEVLSEAASRLEGNISTQLKKNLLEFIIQITYSNNDFDTAYPYIIVYEKFYGNQNFDVNLKKLTIYLSSKKYDAARNLIFSMTENINNDYNQITQLTNLMIRYGLLDETVEVYNIANKKFNNPSFFLSLLTNIYEARMQYDSMLIEYKNFLVSQPFNPYFFEKFKTLLYSKKLFSVFLHSVSKEELLKFSKIIQALPVIADACFFEKKYELFSHYYLEYFRHTQYNRQIIENLIVNLADAGHKDIAVNLLYMLIKLDIELTDSQTYKRNLFKFNVAENPFFVNLIIMIRLQFLPSLNR